MTNRRMPKSIDGMLVDARSTPYRRTKYANYSQRRVHTSKLQAELVTVNLTTASTPPRSAPAAQQPQNPEHVVGQTARKSKKFSYLHVAAAVVFVFGLGVSVQGLIINKKVDSQAQTLAAQDVQQNNSNGLPDNGVPSENLDSDYSTLLANHSAPASHPKILTIDKAGIATRILPMGLTESGAIEAPRTIYDAGWYTKSSLPGMSGATFIDGHVHGITKPGVFYELKNLQEGDKITLTKGDNTTLHYQVKAIKKYSLEEVDMRQVLSPISDKPGLNLMTCHGSYDTSSGYQERLVVFSELIE